MRLLRIVPDDTKFDFMRFRRISFPSSAALSILAMLLYFFHGLNFGIDFKGGTLLEVRGGRNAISAIDAGFSRALSTILDSNITTFIAAAVLFYIGTGPVRGFAVTLGIGIVTTVFTAFTLTRLIVAMWVRWWRPKTVPI